ncbi:MAG: chemotaxis protein CheD [Pseudomonadota bacterium]
MLEPGEYYATSTRELLYTLLGSCISACIFDLENGVAGMNHFMLPGVLNPRNMLLNDIGRYGMFAMELLIGEIIKQGGDRRHLNAKIFGGASVMKTGGNANIPQANIHFARKYLELEGIPLLAECVGGTRGRKVLFFPETGKVLLKYIESAQAMAPLEKAEELYVDKVRHTIR